MGAVQSYLNFDGCTNPQFATPAGLGRVGVAGFVLGILLGIHLCLLVIHFWANGWTNSILLQWTIYMCSICAFHFSEFFVTALYKPDTVSYDSYVISHSTEYTVAVLVSWVEFWTEALLFPHAKLSPRLVALGLVLVGVGQAFRISAMCTAGSNFNHQIMQEREDNHKLVTHGVYRKLRHPSYCGWFWWSVGSQVLLCNPVSFVGYTLASWDFFRKRIPYEEALLLKFYPEQYPAYMTRTWIGIPFIGSSRAGPNR